MPAKRRSGPGAGLRRLRDPCDMAKAELLEPQSPDDEKYRPSAWHLTPTSHPALASYQGQCNLRGVERGPMRALKEMSGAPTSRSDVRRGRTWDRLRGASPRATECPQ